VRFDGDISSLSQRARAATGETVGVSLAPAPVQHVPDFFIVGHPKSGTTALYEMLKRHPQIFMCEEKEPWYFSPELRFRPPPRKPFAIPESLEQYLSLFEAAGPQQRAGEASTTYLWSRAAASLIADARPDARIVAILREPASFLRSLHLQFIEAHIETESDLRRALALEAARREDRHIPRHSYWPQMLQYAEHVRYVEQLRRYEAVFPPEQLLVLIYDDFRADNHGTVRTVLRFLGVDDAAPVESVELNSTVHARSQAVHELVHAVAVGRGPISHAVKAAVTAITPRGPRRRLLGAVRRRVVYRDPPVPDEQLMGELRVRFKPEVEALSEYLGRDLVSLWGYDNIS
jgi:Sulfotransferase domain